jgi:hypothetical protein
MKKAGSLLLGITLLSWLAAAQTKIEITSKPQHKNAGRILELDELMRITDESGEFFFRRPYRLSLDRRGSIYFRDGDFFLKFSPQGRFMGNFFYKGQGPGEVQAHDYHIRGDTINVWDTRGRKVVFYDLDGQYLREFKPEQHSGLRLVGQFGNSLIFSTYDFPEPEERKGMMGVNHHILLIDKDSGDEKEMGSFPVLWHVSAVRGVSYAPFRVLPNADGGMLFINDSSEYIIKVMDTSTGEILRIIRRKYKRVRAPKRPTLPGDTLPEREYSYDIAYMLWDEGQIWIRTSTENKDKGVLFDVFSPEGAYLDSFYVPLKMSIMYAQGDIVFARTQDEDGIYSVVKLRILNGPQLNDPI